MVLPFIMWPRGMSCGSGCNRRCSPLCILMRGREQGSSAAAFAHNLCFGATDIVARQAPLLRYSTLSKYRHLKSRLCQASLRVTTGLKCAQLVFEFACAGAAGCAIWARMKSSRIQIAVRTSFFAVSLACAQACIPPAATAESITPAQMAQRFGTRIYPSLTVERATAAAATALATGGYEITGKDVALGTVRTGPKVTAAWAYGGVLRRLELSWKVNVTQEAGAQVRIVLAPRQFLDGGEVTNDTDAWNTDIKTAHDQIWKEIDDVLGIARPAAPSAPAH
jgi:hypothetical protein